MPFLDTDGVSLYYEDTGSGAPVVMLHGFTSSFAGTWGRRGWIQFLADSGFRVAGLDFRNHGASGRVYDAADATTEKLVADVVALLDRLDLGRAAVCGSRWVGASRSTSPRATRRGSSGSSSPVWATQR